ncbi:Retrovirus-related Pol polyprotein from transposon opus [Cucumis melo var. makuwa]|uniref:Retrovirus-related Pol polyprotein from transposon opus n=1 Tax=Cucumis melo var. makuwa TaxID=1194695 RepID=A0A5D3E4T3_CUCMM|nr:Retrovirus-related Pol polyprotein from transposon opus [Cucumis melo var. makuwa]TYK30942.1 Retrovirus-related Pol polyprotein from transposon opus [Cucumis melo var. makuwa]
MSIWHVCISSHAIWIMERLRDISKLRRFVEMMQRDTIVLNWEKCHFMVTEGIVFVPKISNASLKVDVKIDDVSKLPPP